MSRDVVTVSGPDARRYLHSQVSQNIDSMRPGDERWTFVLAPTGKVEVLARVVCVDDETFELDTEHGFGDGLAARLDRFRIRVRAELGRRRDEVDLDPAAHDADRVRRGWPAMGTEITPGETIPAETGITAVAVDFTKGCYPGQELVERMDSRGASAPRQLRVVAVDEGAVAGDPIVDPDTGEMVGTVTTVAGASALGYVRRGSAVGTAPSDASSA
jgi:folate-binding protein YgfZ